MVFVAFTFFVKLLYFPKYGFVFELFCVVSGKTLFAFHIGGVVKAAFKGVVTDVDVFHPFQQESFLVPVEGGVVAVLPDGVFAESQSVQRLGVNDGLVEGFE